LPAYLPRAPGAAQSWLENQLANLEVRPTEPPAGLWLRLCRPVDLAERKLLLPGGRAVEFPIDPFAQCCLLDGVDELGYILQREAAISAYEASHPARINTLAG